MKKVFYSTIFAAIMIGSTVMYTSCQKEEIQKLTNDNSTIASITIPINALIESSNPYNDSGQIYYNNLKFAIEQLAEEVFSTNNYDSILYYTILNSESLRSTKLLTLNDEIVFNSFFDTSTISTKSLISFENHLIQNVPNVSNELLEAVARSKWANYFLDEITVKNGGGIGDKISELEECVNYCMKRKMREMNDWDMFWFTAGLPNSAFVAIGSCVWGCGGGNIIDIPLNGFVEDYITNDKLHEVSIKFTTSIDTIHTTTDENGGYDISINKNNTSDKIKIEIQHPGYVSYLDTISFNQIIQNGNKFDIFVNQL